MGKMKCSDEGRMGKLRCRDERGRMGKTMCPGDGNFDFSSLL